MTGLVLDAVEVVPVDALLGRAAGELCGATSTDDPIDAAVALICQAGDVVLSSDRAQMASLVAETGTAAEVVAV